MEFNFKKSAKLVLLILSSIAIATVSAQVYRYMYIDGSVTVGSAKMVWILGADAPGDASISGSTATIDLDVEQGTPLNFTEALFILNNGSVTYTYELNVTTAVLPADFTECAMHVYTNSSGSWVYLDTLDLTNSTDYYTNTLDAGDYLRMTFDVTASGSASGTKPFDVQVRYEE